MDKATRRSMLLIVFTVGLFAVLMNLGAVLEFLLRVSGLFLPIIIGLVLAFVLSVPMNGFVNIFNRLFAKAKHKPSMTLLRLISLLLTLICISLVLVLVGTMVLPELINSISSLYSLVRAQIPSWLELLNEYDIDADYLISWLNSFSSEQLGGFNPEEILRDIASGGGALISSLAGVATSTISGLITGIFALIICIYVMLSKHDLARQSKKFIYANLKPASADRLCHVASLTQDTYSKFLSGQCVEAMILGVLIFTAFTIARLPYAILLAILTATCAFIPYIGAFFACFTGVFLTLIAIPEKALLCFIVYLAVQFVENQFIYPHVVGNSVGLSPLWTLVAALIGGKLFGLLGIIFFIPLVSVIYHLVRENTNQKLEAKEIDI